MGVVVETSAQELTLHWLSAAWRCAQGAVGHALILLIIMIMIMDMILLLRIVIVILFVLRPSSGSPT